MFLLDSAKNYVKVPLKVDKIACDYFCTAELLQLMGVQHKIVAASNALFVLKDFYLQGVPDMSKVVNFVNRVTPQFELLGEKDPDVWIVSEPYSYGTKTRAAVIVLDQLTFDFENIYNSGPVEAALLAGYIFNNTAAAQKYVKWYISTWEMLDGKTKNLDDGKKPCVFYTGYDKHVFDSNVKEIRVFPDNTVCWQAVKLADGKNLIDDYPGTIVKKERPTSNVNMGATSGFEWLKTKTFEYAFVHCTKYQGQGLVSPNVPDHGYTCKDPSEYKNAQAALANHAFFENCDAAKIHLTPGDYMNGASGGMLTAIMVATTIHPDLFPNLDLKAEHQKYLDMMGFDYDVSKNGVFYY